jgi:hypothetical protein
LSCYKKDVCKFSSGRNFTNRGEMLDESLRFPFTILTETWLYEAWRSKKVRN